MRPSGSQRSRGCPPTQKRSASESRWTTADPSFADALSLSLGSPPSRHLSADPLPVSANARGVAAHHQPVSIILQGMPEKTSAVHRYSGATTSSGEEVLCASCAALRTPPLTQHEAVTSVCSDCEKKYRGVWSRWQPLLATQTSFEDPAPSVDELRRFVADAKIAFNDVVFQKGHPDVYLVNQGGRRIAFPCVRLDLVRERQPLSRWRPILQSCKWFMPAFIRGGRTRQVVHALACVRR